MRLALVRKANVADGFFGSGQRSIGSGDVDWFDTSSEPRVFLTEVFGQFPFAGISWNLDVQPSLINERLAKTSEDQPGFVCPLLVRPTCCTAIRVLQRIFGSVPACPSKVWHVGGGRALDREAAWSGLMVILDRFSSVCQP